MKAVIEAAIAKLKATAGVTALVSTRIHKALPLSPTFPCLSVRGVDMLPWDTKGNHGAETTLQVDTWTRNDRDYDDAHSVMAAVKSALHETALTVSGESHVFTRLRMAEVMADPDGATTHGVQRFQVITHE